MCDATKGFLVIVGCCLLLGGCVASCAGYQYGTVQDDIVVTVDSKESVASGGSSEYLLFTENEVFTIDDTLFHGRWDSSDWYAKIDEGETYKFKVYGWRVPFMSMYRNVISMEKVESQ